MPIGRNLLYLDIVDINSKGRRVFTQVTFEDNDQKVNEKLEKLKESISKTDRETKLIFFAPKTDYIESNKKEFSGIEIIPIEKVYDNLKIKNDYKVLIDIILKKF